MAARDGCEWTVHPTRRRTCVRCRIRAPYLREKARQLRIEKNLSLPEIAARLALPKTTIFYWIRDLPNPELKHVDTPARARSRAKAARTNAAKYKGLRDAAYRRGSDEYPSRPSRRFATSSRCSSPRDTSERASRSQSQVEQQWACRKDLAISIRRPDRHLQRHIPPFPHASLDGLPSRTVARLGRGRGVAQPGRAFGLGPKGRRFKSAHPDFLKPRVAGSKWHLSSDRGPQPGPS
jgi:transcriptional regulator with XRE-family HTH domain